MKIISTVILSSIKDQELIDHLATSFTQQKFIDEEVFTIANMPSKVVEIEKKPMNFKDSYYNYKFTITSGF